MIPHLPGWKILLLGTDINQQLLEKARNGIYSKWSFRNRKYSPEEYFTSTSDQRFRISETIRDMVTLGWLNLAEPVYPSPLNNTCDLDIIFCRNVMIYFTPEMISQVTERFFSCLAKGGILIVSPADMTPYIYEKFSRTVYQGYTIYHKSRVSTEQKERQLPGFMAEMQEILLPFPEPIPAPRPESPLTDFFEHHIPSVPAETEQSIAHTETVSLKEISVADIRRLADEGKYHEGAALCQEALRLKRSDHLLHFLLGTIYTEMGMTDQAVESFKKVIYLEKDFIMAHYLLAKLLMEKGEAQQSVKVRKILIRLLSGLPSAAVVPESGDFTAGQFLGLVQSELSYRN
jgi:chemotaxis protein methyltransferase CheR